MRNVVESVRVLKDTGTELPLPSPKDVHDKSVGMFAAGVASDVRRAVECGLPIEEIEPSIERVQELAEIVAQAQDMVTNRTPYSKSGGFFPFWGTPSVEKACNAITQLHEMLERDVYGPVPIELAAEACFWGFVSVERNKKVKELLAMPKYQKVVEKMKPRSPYKKRKRALELSSHS